MSVSDKKILSLTLNKLLNTSLEDMLEMLKNNLDEINDYSSEYALSIASAIVKRVLLIKNFSHQYKKFYKVIISDVFRKNKHIYGCLVREGLSNLKALYDIYDDNMLLIDSIFSDEEKMFDEIVINEEFNINDLFSKYMIDSFNTKSYKVFLSHLLKGKDKNRVIKALIRSKNTKFVYMVSRMDDIVLRYTKDDNEFFDAVLTLLNYNNYRRLLWDYYNKYIGRVENEQKLGLKKEDIPDELYKLLSYTFFLVNSKYTNDKIFDIAPSIDEMIKVMALNMDMMHISVFGVDGYDKIKTNTFDSMLDFNKIDDDNKLLNLKVAFFGTIYGVTYKQAERLINNYSSFIEEDDAVQKEDKLTYDTLVAMKSLYDLSLDDESSIDLYRNVYYKYVKKHGIYCDVEVPALVIMESLMRRMYNNSIELI